MPRLNIIIASVRENRGGKAVADWFTGLATRHGKFDVDVSDLKTIALPMLEEPNHPRLQQYTRDYTRQWSETVKRSDAFAIVTPEYNFGTPPALVNALDYLFHEWHYKPAGFVSYGGVSGGLRSVQMTKQILTTLKVVPIVEAVTLPFYAQSMKDGVFSGEAHEKGANAMLDELARWTTALRSLRAS